MCIFWKFTILCMKIIAKRNCPFGSCCDVVSLDHGRIFCDGRRHRRPGMNIGTNWVMVVKYDTCVSNVCGSEIVYIQHDTKHNISL